MTAVSGEMDNTAATPNKATRSQKPQVNNPQYSYLNSYESDSDYQRYTKLPMPFWTT